MNTTSTTIQPFVLEIWGTRLTSYLSAVGMVVLLYDCLLTLDNEMRLVWPGALTLPNFFYYLNRYISVAAIILCNYQQAALRPAVSTTLFVLVVSDWWLAHLQDLSCRVWILVSGTAIPVANFSSTVLLTLRVIALYRNVRWVTPVLWTAFVLFQGLRFAMTFDVTAELFWSIRYSPMSNLCMPTDLKYRSVAPMMVPGVYDLTLLALTLIKGIRSAISLRGNSGSAMMYTLVRDEIIYFSIISTLRIFNSIAWVVLPPSLMGVTLYAEWGLEVTLVSRFFLNLRYIAFHQQQTALGTPDTPFTFSTQTAWKQSGRLTTDFIVDLSMDMTTHDNEDYPNEGDIHQAETLHLEIIKFQNQHNATEGSMSLRQ